MGATDGQSTGAERPAEPSLGHLLAVWVLVTPSLAAAGTTAPATITFPVPAYSGGAGYLFGTVVVATLWVVGVRPGIKASAGYFLLQQGLFWCLLVAVSPVLAPGTGAVPVVRGLSIGLAATVAFAETGRRFRTWLRKRGRTLLRLPESTAAKNSRNR